MIKNIIIILFTILLFLLIYLLPTDSYAYSSIKDLQSMIHIDDWQQEGYTGEGIEIIVIDKGNLSMDYSLIKNVEDPFNNVLTTKKNVTSHLSKVVETIHTNVPDAKIYVFQDISMTYIYDWIKENKKDIDIVNFSLSRNLTERENKIMPSFIDEGILLVTPIGNNRTENINPVALNPYWISVGAVEKEENTFKRANYSGIHEALDVMSFTSIPLKEDVFIGTSASAPFLAGTIALYLDGYKQTYNKKANRTHILEVIKNNTLKEEWMNKKEYGYGLFQLPSSKIFKNDSELKPEISGTTNKIIKIQKQHILSLYLKKIFSHIN